MPRAPTRFNQRLTPGIYIAARWSYALALLIAIVISSDVSNLAGVQTADADPKKRATVNASQQEAHLRINRLKAERPFWEWLGNPHGRELDLIFAKIEGNRQIARNVTLFDYSGGFQHNALRERRRALADALEMLAYAATLAPQDERVLVVTAEVAYDAGETQLATATLRRLLRLAAEHALDAELSRNQDDQRTHSQRVPARLHAMLGTLLAKRGPTSEAADHLAIAIGNGSPDVVQRAVFVLANLEMTRGRIDEAIDLLVNTHNVSNTAPLALALAVAYDRNDQAGLAAATLAALSRQQALSGAMLTPYSTDPIKFANAADRHYYRALIYQTAGELALARSEWLACEVAATTRFSATSATADRFTPRFVARAREHLRDIDRLAGTGSGAKKRPTAKTNTLPLSKQPAP